MKSMTSLTRGTIWASCFRKVQLHGSWTLIVDTVAGVEAESSHLNHKQEAGKMARISTQSKPAFYGIFPPTRSCLLSFPKSVINRGLSIQMPGTMVVICHSGHPSSCKQWWHAHISRQAVVILTSLETQREQCFFCAHLKKLTVIGYH